MNDDGLTDHVTMTLGMLALTQDTILRTAAGEYDQ